MNTAAAPATDSSRLVQVWDDYLAAMQAGTAPDRAEFVARHPDLAGELEECLASLEFIRKAAARASPLDGIAADPAGPEALGQLGDFRILRELGRGGMG